MPHLFMEASRLANNKPFSVEYVHSSEGYDDGGAWGISWLDNIMNILQMAITELFYLKQPNSTSLYPPATSVLPTRDPPRSLCVN